MAERVVGKHFSITDPQGVNTVIYRVIRTSKELTEKYPKYTVERLVSTEELNNAGKKKTFFVDFPKPEGEDLVILSFGKNRVVVNKGKLTDSRLRISKAPLPVQFNTLYSEFPTEFKNFKYTPNLQRQITIIDPETAEEVKPSLYFDQATNEVKGKCKLKPYKSYFSFEIKDKNN